MPASGPAPGLLQPGLGSGRFCYAGVVLWRGAVRCGVEGEGGERRGVVGGGGAMAVLRKGLGSDLLIGKGREG